MEYDGRSHQLGLNPLRIADLPADNQIQFQSVLYCYSWVAMLGWLSLAACFCYLLSGWLWNKCGSVVTQNSPYPRLHSIQFQNVVTLYIQGHFLIVCIKESWKNNISTLVWGLTDDVVHAKIIRCPYIAHLTIFITYMGLELNLNWTYTGHHSVCRGIDCRGIFESSERDILISSNNHLYLISINYCNNEAGRPSHPWVLDRVT
jgi:hypothetical protein